MPFFLLIRRAISKHGISERRRSKDTRKKRSSEKISEFFILPKSAQRIYPKNFSKRPAEPEALPIKAGAFEKMAPGFGEILPSRRFMTRIITLSDMQKSHAT